MTYMGDLLTFGGTRILQNNRGLVGRIIQDPEEQGRLWCVISLYAPLKRHLGGIRAKCQDEKGFVTFINQRDLEVLLGTAKSGSWCAWLGEEYPEPGCGSYLGFCMDAEDIEDDLYDKELLIRGQLFELVGTDCVIPEGTEIEQYLHYSVNNDAIRRCLLRWDKEQSTGISPDTKLSTIMERWIPYEVEKVEWRKL